MNDASIALGFAVFIWWFSTGIVILLNRMSRTAVALSLVLSSLLGVAALFGLAHTAQQTGVTGAYCAFTSALLVWGWNELTFLTGWITGPRTTALPVEAVGWPRFVQSLRAVLWHELAILLVGCAIVAITWNAPNQVGTGTYLVLWTMRTSAKLNLFLGVRNLSEEFLPAHLAYLESFFRRRRLNIFFPFALALASMCLWWLVGYASNPLASQAQSVGAVLVATLLALAIVEHLMLVLPVDTTALWRWALRKKQNNTHAVSSEPQTVSVMASAMDKHDKVFQIH
jgi:putative photosynthetic complex assembly protein 2